jgi:hypothetical protein
MKLPEFKAILKTVSEERSLGEKSSKQVVTLEIPARKYSDDWGEEKETRAEFFECDIINRKISPEQLKALEGKRVTVQQSYLNGYEYEEVDAVGKKTGQTKYGKSITINRMVEWKS